MGWDLADAAKRASEFVTECLSLPTPLIIHRQTKYREALESLQIWDSKLGRPKIFAWIVIATSFLYSIGSGVSKINELVKKLAEFF
jgi:hypothetical protein